MNAIHAQGAELLGVSTQDVKSHAAFAKKLKLNFPILADVGGKVSRAYGVLMPVGMANRVTFVIGPRGYVRSTDEHVDFNKAGADALYMLREMKGSSAGASTSVSAPAEAPSAVNYPGWPSTATIRTLADGLKIEELAPGMGEPAKTGNTVTVHYTGYLLNGTKFDSSLDRGTPFTFHLGEGQVIKGWDEGLVGMRVNGRRKLVIPPSLGYGAMGTGGVIPPNATLVFDVEMLAIGP